MYMYMYVHMRYMYNIHVYVVYCCRYMRVSENHNSPGCKLPSGLDVQCTRHVSASTCTPHLRTQHTTHSTHYALNTLRSYKVVVEEEKKGRKPRTNTPHPYSTKRMGHLGAQPSELEWWANHLYTCTRYIHSVLLQVCT